MIALNLSPGKRNRAALLFSQFQQNMNLLKSGIETHNKREVYESSEKFRSQGGRSNRKYFLKNISQAKYNNLLAKTMTIRTGITLKQPSIPKTIDPPKHSKIGSLDKSLMSPKTERMKDRKEREDLRKRLAVKQRKVEEQWAKIITFRTENSISECSRLLKTRRERLITSKLEKIKSTNSSTYTSNKTYTQI